MSSAGGGFKLTPEQEASFDRQPRYVKVNGPLTLLRLWGEQEGKTNADYALSSPVGVFWFNSRFFWNIIEEVTNNSADKGSTYVNSRIRWLVRQKTAVSQDWNAFQFITTLDLPQGQTLEAWVGRIRPQPLNQPGSLRAAGIYGPGPTLPGHAFQYVIARKALETTLKPYISTDFRPFWISGISHLNVRQ